MKTMLILLTLLAFCAHGQDVRIVSGRSVNLQPVWNWLADKQGDRPLKHWKRFFITAIEKQVGQLTQCTVLTEDGGVKKILLANLDPTIKGPLSALAETDARIAKLESELSYQPPPRERFTPEQEGWMKHFQVEAESKKRVELDSLTRVREDSLLSAAREASKRPLLAMFTWQHQERENLEVWDCGLKQ